MSRVGLAAVGLAAAALSGEPLEPRERIHARLCERDGHLIYLLTVLATDGKVAQASIDAANGALLGPRAQEK